MGQQSWIPELGEQCASLRSQLVQVLVYLFWLNLLLAAVQ